jgi:hypothetical protein
MSSSSVRAAGGAAVRWAALGIGAAIGIAVAIGVAATEVSAAEPWLRVTGSERCSVPARALAARIRETTIGTPDPLFAVHVSISDGTRTSARVRLALGSRSIGVKELEASTCAEVLEAVATVVALALSSESEASVVAPVTTPRRAELERERATWAVDEPRRALPELGAMPEQGASVGAASLEPTPRTAALPTDALAEPSDPGLDTPGWRLLFGIGADRGSLREPTVVIQAGGAASLGRGELRALASYGVPSVREEVSDVFRRVRADVGALALDYCRGLDAERWVSACAGLELGLRRYSRIEQAAEEPRIEREHFEPSTSVLAGLAFVYRDATVQPQLDVTLRRALLGALAESPALGFRAALGAAVQF